MCKRCDDFDTLMTAVNAGEHPFDGEVLKALVDQNMKVLEEMVTDIDSGDKPLHELLEECAKTMHGIGVAGVVNARTVMAAARCERRRVVRSNPRWPTA